MKKVLFALALPALLFSCKGEGEFTLKGDVKGVDGKSIVLQVQDDSLGPKPLDTVKIENGKFEFKGKSEEPALYSLKIESLQASSFFVAEEGDIHILINKDSLNKVDVSGTYNNDKMTEFTKKTIPVQKKIMDYQQANQARMMKAQQTNDTATMNTIRKEFTALRDGMNVNAKEFITKNKDSYVSILLIKNRTFNPEADFVEIQALYDGLDAGLKNSKEGKKLAKRIKDAQKITVGKKAPDFTAPTPDGGTATLSKSLGKITIIDFWASWCGPCRKANPEMVKLYTAFHDKGLNVIGVSLDKPGQQDKWKEAIAKDGLAWTQVSNLKEWQDPIAKKYNVEAIPQMFILNEQGVVIAMSTDLKKDDLAGKIAKALTPAPPMQINPAMQSKLPQPTK